MWSRHKDGRLFGAQLTLESLYCASGEILGLLGIYDGITENDTVAAHHTIRASIESRDDASSLALKVINDELMKPGGAATERTVYCININDFQRVLLARGDSDGEAAKRVLTARLEDVTAGIARIVPMGEDSFAAISDIAHDGDRTLTFAKQLQQCCALPIEVDAFGGLSLHACIGVVQYPQDGFDARDLLRNAQAALHQTKSNARSYIEVYCSDIADEAARDVALESQLRTVLAEDEFLLHYQPQVHLETGQTIGVEALIRWQHPVRGLVAPGEFIPMIDAGDLAGPVGCWVLNAAARDAVRWQKLDIPPLHVSVNICPAHIISGTLAEDVTHALNTSGLDPQSLKLEVLESAVIHDMEGALAELERMRALGVSLALDDFGTGYSSLSYLKNIPVDTVKIDRMFVANLVSSSEDAAIVRSTISMAHNLGQKVVAEGVETEAQLLHLMRMGCDMIQGYLACRPIPREQLDTQIAENGR